MKKDKLFKEILDLLDEDEKTQVWLLERLKGIMKQDENKIFSNLLRVFTHLEMDPKLAEKTWNDILKHRKEMSKSLDRNIGLRVAMLDYFIAVNKQIRNPKIIEIEIFEKLERSLVTDEITGLYNKRFFQQAFYREVQRAKRYRTDLSIMFVDIDDFKNCNDLKGHVFGDRVLKRVAEIIKAGLREVDFPCRFGGDEFVIILPETRGSKAVIAAERLRKDVLSVNFFPEDEYYITVSAGVASFGIDGNTVEELVDNADTALFRAKNDGKNRVYVFYREKRKFERASTDWDINFRILKEKKVKTAKLKNVAGGGLLFESKKPIPIASVLDITLKSPSSGEEVSAQAKVARLEVKENGMFDIGIIFTKIDPEDQKKIVKQAE